MDLAAPWVGVLSSDYVGDYLSKSNRSLTAPVSSSNYDTSNQAMVNRITAANGVNDTRSLWTPGCVNPGNSVGPGCTTVELTASNGGGASARRARHDRSDTSAGRGHHTRLPSRPTRQAASGGARAVVMMAYVIGNPKSQTR